MILDPFNCVPLPTCMFILAISHWKMLPIGKPFQTKTKISFLCPIFEQQILSLIRIPPNMKIKYGKTCCNKRVGFLPYVLLERCLNFGYLMDLVIGIPWSKKKPV